MQHCVHMPLYAVMYSGAVVMTLPYAAIRPGSNPGDAKVVLTLGSRPRPPLSLPPWRRPRGVALDFVLNSLVGLINQLGGPQFGFSNSNSNLFVFGER